MKENILVKVEKLIREKKIDKAQLELSKLGSEFYKNPEYLYLRGKIFYLNKLYYLAIDTLLIALECGCIPIVENAYKYYERLFPNNPFIKVDRWIEAKPVIREWQKDQIEQKREECRTWWSQYKNQLQEFTINKINL